MLTKNYVKAKNVIKNKYSKLQISIHQLVFLLVIAAYCAIKFRSFFPRSNRPLINMIHVSCGISILVLIVVRLLLKLKYPTPPIIPKPKPIITKLAHLKHLVIYLLFIALPVISLVIMYNQGNPQFAFSLTMPYASKANFKQVNSLKSQHKTLANLKYFVIKLHAAAALAHHYF